MSKVEIRISNIKCQRLQLKAWKLNIKHWILKFKSFMMKLKGQRMQVAVWNFNTEYQISNVEHWILNIKCQSKNVQARSLPDQARRSLDRRKVVFIKFWLAEKNPPKAERLIMTGDSLSSANQNTACTATKMEEIVGSSCTISGRIWPKLSLYKKICKCMNREDG